MADIPPGERAVRFLAAGGTLVLPVDAAVRTAVTAKPETGLLG